ncbi:hypothetical protein GTO27_11460 [Candidatus Bathyarchaeota archaeon]|nr:hypothetical protein [Candidatus Bathyarchaeota archaeon]
MAIGNRAKHISSCLELAILFEISADKPGNVNLIVGFEGTRYEHFLASAVATASSFELAAERGLQLARGGIRAAEVGLGRIIRDCISDINAWQSGGNTLLGTVILLSPIAVAAGMVLADEERPCQIPKIREKLELVVKSTTPEDAVDVYEAIRIANPSGLGRAPRLDVNDPESINRIREEKIRLFDTFVIASKYDRVCSEWVENYPITFEVAYPFLVEQIREGKDLTISIVHAFLKVLSEYPDTFIARKAGTEEAQNVSSMAANVLELGGLESTKGKAGLLKFDSDLRRSGNLLNPGTTADIIAAALSLIVLGGYRP